MHRRTGSCYISTVITAENSTDRNSSYIKESFRLWLRFVETGDLKKKKKVANGEGEGNCSKNWTDEKECKGIGKKVFENIGDGQ